VNHLVDVSITEFEDSLQSLDVLEDNVCNWLETMPVQ